MKLRSAALLVAALVPALQAHAAEPATTAFASASNFRITLIDLDLNDGIEASLEYVALPEGAEAVRPFAEAQHVHWSTSAEFSHREHQNAPWQPVSTSTSLQDGAATLSASGSVSGTSLSTLNVSVKASATNPDGLTWAYGRAFVPLAFRLSPNTALSVTFDLSVGSTHPGMEAPGSAESDVHAWIGPWTQPFYQRFEVSHSLGADRFGDIGEAGTRTFTAKLTSDAQALDFGLSVHASASALTASPVPEPSTWGMLLGGLAMVGAVARRGRKRA